MLSSCPPLQDLHSRLPTATTATSTHLHVGQSVLRVLSHSARHSPQKECPQGTMEWVTTGSSCITDERRVDEADASWMPAWHRMQAPTSIAHRCMVINSHRTQQPNPATPLPPDVPGRWRRWAPRRSDHPGGLAVALLPLLLLAPRYCRGPLPQPAGRQRRPLLVLPWLALPDAANGHLGWA